VSEGHSLQQLYLAFDEQADDTVLLAIADAHEEEGNERAKVWRWMGLRSKQPYRRGKECLWADGAKNEGLLALGWVLSSDLFEEVVFAARRFGGELSHNRAHVVFARPSDACRCLAEVLAGLPALP